MEIIFYCISGNINQFLFTFLYQLVNKNSKKVLLYSEHENLLENLNNLFWEECKDTMFLPHDIFRNN